MQSNHGVVWGWVVVLGLLPGSLPAAELVATAKIDALAQELIDGGWSYGLAIGLVSEQGEQTAGYGRVSESDGARPDADNVFEIGSITKVFTGLVLAQMAEEKLLSLDDPVQTLLGDSIAIPQYGDEPIRLIDLTTHASGLPRMPTNFFPKDPNDPYADYTVEQLAQFLGKLKLRRAPRERYEYSNLAVGLLGHALALKEQTTYEAMVRKRICEPLAMHDTTITLDDSQRSRLAAGHDVEGRPAANWHLPALAGAGALRSTVRDLLTFLKANMEMAETPFDGAIRASHVVRFPFDAGGGMALGWHVRQDGVVWHNGGTGGYHTYAGFDPEKKVGVVVLSNSATMHADLLSSRLLDLLRTGEAEPLALPRSVPLEADVLEPLVGRYKIAGGPKVLITRDGATLQLQVVGQPRIALSAESSERFFCRLVPDASFTFGEFVEGSPRQLTLRQNGRDVLAEREP